MRVARIVLGIIMVSISVLAFLGGTALWIATQHESSDGGFGGRIAGLPATAGTAIVVPDVNALLRSNATLTGRSGTSVIVNATSTPVPAFLGIAPLSAIQAYLGSAAYTRVTDVHTGFGGITVTTQASGVSAVPVRAPAAQGFWSAKGTGRLSWSPSDHDYDGLALVIMRADGAGPLAVTARAEVKPDWLSSTRWALFGVGTAVAVLAVALLIWPTHRRDVVYVVEPAQLPEIASRLGLTLVTSSSSTDESLPPGSVIARVEPTLTRLGAVRERIWRVATRWAGSTARHRLDDEIVPSVFGAGIPTARASIHTHAPLWTSPSSVDPGSAVPTSTRAGAAAGAGIPAEPGRGGGLPAEVLAALTVHTGATPILGAPGQHAMSGGAEPDWDGPTQPQTVVGSAPVVPQPASTEPARAADSVSSDSPQPANIRIPDIFADPKTRPNSLRTAMLLDLDGMRAPTRTNERGIYRTVGTPPLVTPAFVPASSEN